MAKNLMLRLPVVMALLVVTAAGAQTKPKDAELDALELTVEPAKTEASAKTAPKHSRVAIEAAVGRYDLRHGLGSEDSSRLSLDWRYAARLTPSWRVVVSDRLDHVKPAEGDRNINTLREAFLGWQSTDAANAVEFGRINLRTGPGYGFNPSDFFRDGSLRTSTTLDPIALRDYRMGAVAVRAQRLWKGGGLSFVAAPKLADRPNPDGASLDLGSTNHSTRVQLGWSHDLARGVSMQLLGFKQDGESFRLGGNVTALVGDSAVFHFEAAHGRERSLFDRVFEVPAPAQRRATRLATGITSVLPGSLSLTAELQYNGTALSERELTTLASGPGGLLASNLYLAGADRLQDLAARRALLIYLSKKGLGIKGLDLTAFVRTNADDHSRLVWAELRKQFGGVDLALQWQQLQGGATSEFGVLPLRRSYQLVLTLRL